MDLKNSFIYILIDIPSTSVLTRVKSLTCGRALSKGILDTEVVPLPSNLGTRHDEYVSKDLWNGYWIYNGRTVSLSELPEHIKSDERYQKIRSLAKLRHNYQYALETYYQINLVRSFDFYDYGFDLYIQSQLDKVNTATNEYPQAIKEYALISGISEENAYEELAMRSQTYGLIKTRNYALYQKYVYLLNQVDTEPELEVVIKQAIKELKNNAQV